MNISSNCNYEILILYGSQTGTSKFAAEEMSRELYKFDFKCNICEMDSYEFVNLPEENFIIFIISTTGYGEFPTNSKNFWSFLMRKDLPADSLENINYSVFGLGDSSYEKFNQCAKLLNSRLLKLSANLFHPIGLGDDQHDFGYEAEFDPWIKSVKEELFNYFPDKIEFKDKKKNIFDYYLENILFEVNILDKDLIFLNSQNNLESSFDDFCGKNDNNISNHALLNKIFNDCKRLIYDKRLFEKVKINVISEISNIELITSQDAIKKVFNVDILIKNKIQQNDEKKIETLHKQIFFNFLDEKTISHNSKLNFTDDITPGDSILFFPENDHETVNKFLKIIGLNDKNLLLFNHKVNENLKDVKFPFIINAYDFAKKWLNIKGYPNRFFCYICSLFTNESLYREKLELFSSKSSVK